VTADDLPGPHRRRLAQPEYETCDWCDAPTYTPQDQYMRNIGTTTYWLCSKCYRKSLAARTAARPPWRDGHDRPLLLVRPADPRRGSPLRGPIRHLVDLRRLLPDDSTRLEADAMRAAHPRPESTAPTDLYYIRVTETVTSPQCTGPLGYSWRECKVTSKRVLLIDVDSKIPNLALMKLSSWHKARGDLVGFNVIDPDLIYASVVFKKNRHLVDG